MMFAPCLSQGRVLHPPHPKVWGGAGWGHAGRCFLNVQLHQVLSQRASQGPTGAAPSQSAGQWDLGTGDSQPCTLLSILPGHPGAGLGRAKPQALGQKHWVPSAPCSGPGFSFWSLWAALMAWFQCAALWEQDPGVIPWLLCWRRLLVLLRPLLS